MSDVPSLIMPISSPRTLQEINFTDLNFSEAGEAWLRNVEGVDEPIVGVPESAMADLSVIHQRVCHRGQTENSFAYDHDGVRYRVTRIDAVNGRWFTLRRLMYPIPRLASPEFKGIPLKVIQYLGQIAKPPGGHGLIIVSGATTTGKTTTACSLLQEYMVIFGDVGVTVEDPPELPLDGPHGRAGWCHQTEAVNGNFADAMKATMRHAPRYILLGEVRSGAEAREAIAAANNGHIVITTIHAGNCIEAINRMLKFVSGTENLELARGMLADGLMGVLNQKLVRVKGKRQIQMEYFFPGDGQGLRSLIRTGKTEQLSTAIANQASRVMQGKLPVSNEE